MARPRTARLLLGFGRSVALAGAALTIAAIVSEAFLFFRFSPDWNVGLMPLIVLLRAVIAGGVVWAVLRLGPDLLLWVLLASGFGGFLALYGWYLLLAGAGGELMAIGDLLYLVAALLVGGGILASRADSGGETV